MAERPLLVGLVVLNWNGWADTQECLASLREVTYPNIRVYAVDNGSADGSPEKIAAEFPEHHLVALQENRGFGGGMNAGLEAALEDGCDHVLCLNNDMVVEPGFLEPLVEAATNRAVPYPALFRRAQPDTIDTLGHRIDLHTGLTWMIAAGQREIPDRITPDYTEVPLLPRTLLEEIGGWDATYFAFYEDADLGLRMRKAGWQLTCVPTSRVYHKRGRTTARVPGLVSYYSMRNRLRVVRRHGSRWDSLTTILHVLVLTLPYLLLRRVLSRRYKHAVRYLLWGVADGLLPGRRDVARSWRPTGDSVSSKS